MKTRKLVTMLLAVLMVCMTANNALAEYTGDAPIFDETLTITILASRNTTPATPFDELNYYQAALKRANVKLEAELLDSKTYKDVASARLAAGVELPDILRLPGVDSDMSYAQSGLLVDLSEYIEKYGFNIKQRFTGEYEGCLERIYTPDGKVYGLPTLNPPNSIRCIMINAPYLEKLGLSAPTDMDQFYNMLVAFKNNDMNGNGDTTDEIPLFMRSGTLGQFGMYWGLDLSTGWELDKNGEMQCSYATQEYYDFLKYFHRLYEEGLLYNEYSVAGADIQKALFAENQIGVILHYISNCESYSYNINPDFDINEEQLIMQVFDAPVGPYGDQAYYGNDLMSSGPQYVITKDCKDPEKVFYFLDWMYSEEAQDYLWFGIEGVDYTKDAEGNFTFRPEFLSNANGYRTEQGYNINCLPVVKHSNVNYLIASEQLKGMYDVAMKYLKMPSIGFAYFLPEEAEVVSMYSADLSTYFNEMFDAFIMGTVELNEANFNEYLATLKGLHVDELTAIYQARYDRTHK